MGLINFLIALVDFTNHYIAIYWNFFIDIDYLDKLNLKSVNILRIKAEGEGEVFVHASKIDYEEGKELSSWEQLPVVLCYCVLLLESFYKDLIKQIRDFLSLGFNNV